MFDVCTTTWIPILIKFNVNLFLGFSVQLRANQVDDGDKVTASTCLYHSAGSFQTTTATNVFFLIQWGLKSMDDYEEKPLVTFFYF